MTQSTLSWHKLLVSMMAVSIALAGCDDDDDDNDHTPSQTETSDAPTANNYTAGVRPLYLINDMDSSALKDKLMSCIDQPIEQSSFSIGHRGAPMQFPEHTRESYIAAAKMGAGILECDVTFTKDKELVCRHAQNDLHTTTNIVATDLANKCTVPPLFSADGKLANASDIECRTSDITLAEFKTLKGKMDAADKTADTIEGYMDGTANWRTDLYTQNGTLMTHAESIALFKELGVKMTPELKSPSVAMPFNGFSQDNYRQKMINEYKAAGVSANDVFVQSFDLDDVTYWINNEPQFGQQAVYLDDKIYKNGAGSALVPADYQAQIAAMPSLYAQGVRYIAPPLYALVSTDANNNIVASEYAKAAKNAGLNMITWTLERSGPLASGGGWYHQTITPAINNDGDTFEVLDVLAKDVGVKGVFSDWPATTTYYANCMGIK